MVGFFQGEYTWKVHWLWNYTITDRLKEAVAKTKNLSEEEMSVIFYFGVHEDQAWALFCVGKLNTRLLREKPYKDLRM